MSGRTSEARKLLAEFEARQAEKYVPAYEIAKIYVALGEINEAFAWLERAYEERSHSMVFLRIDPQLKPIRNDARFVRLLEKVGLTE